MTASIIFLYTECMPLPILALIAAGGLAGGVGSAFINAKMGGNRAKAAEQANVPQTPQNEPLASPSAMITPSPQPAYRHPRWEQRKQEDPKTFEELLSGTSIASKETSVPQSLLMDLAMIESGGGKFMKQLSGGPGRGFYQYENLPDSFDTLNATASARMAGQDIQKGRLSKWGTPAGTWGSLNNQNRDPADRLTTYYSPEELNQFLLGQYQLP
jgi:hypothetical protein